MDIVYKIIMFLDHERNLIEKKTNCVVEAGSRARTSKLMLFMHIIIIIFNSFTSSSQGTYCYNVPDFKFLC